MWTRFRGRSNGRRLDASGALTLSTRVENGGATVVVSGPMGPGTADRLDAELFAARDHGSHGSILVDMTGATGVDSSAIPPIARAYRHAQRKGTGFVVLTDAGPARRLFAITGLECFASPPAEGLA